MKLSTTTLGCPSWDLNTVLERVSGYGFAGIDFRGLRGEFKLWQLPEFSSDLQESASRISDSGLQVTCISSGIHLSDTHPEKIAEYDEELEHSAEICAALNCPQIRVFGGSLGLADGATEADRDRVTGIVSERVCALAEDASAIAPVDLLIETHDAWTSSEHMAAVLEKVARDDVACCWDVKHTYWTGKEVPEISWDRLRPWVRNTHWKDVKRFRAPLPGYDRNLTDSGVLCLPGNGIAPLPDCYDLLTGDDYDGWFTLEWEKHWHPYIEEPEIAFPRFLEYMTGLAGRK